MGKNEEVNKYTNLIKANKNNIENYKNRANIYVKLEKYMEALKDYNEIIRICNTNAEFFYDRANLYIKIVESSQNLQEERWRNEERYINAIKDYDNAINLDSKNKKYYVEKGDLLTNVFEEDEEALKNYSFAFQLDPKDDKICSLIGDMYSLLDDNINTIKYYKIALKLNPKNYSINFSLASIYDINEEYSKAIKYYTKVIEFGECENSIYCDRANCYYRIRYYSEALKDLEVFAQREGNETERSYFIRGRIYEELEKFEESLNEYIKALSINREGYILEKITQLYLRFKNKNLSNEEINKILDYGVNFKLELKQNNELNNDSNENKLYREVVVKNNIIMNSEENLVNIEDLNDFEEYIGNKLPKEYKNFILKCNGGKPNLFAFITKDKFIESCIMNILPLTNIKMPNLKERYEFYNKGNLIPKTLLVIAIDPIDSPICISVKGKNAGKVYYWNRSFEKDFAKPSYKNIHLVADNFDEFINGLYEEQ